MDDSDPEWLHGVNRSSCRVQRWHDESDRQFCVLPFYENNVVVQGRERYMLWGRAVSDERFYPIPPIWYSLDLVPHRIKVSEHYQWVCQVEPNRSKPIRMEFNSYAELSRPGAGGRQAALAIGGRDVVTPELYDWRA